MCSRCCWASFSAVLSMMLGGRPLCLQPPHTVRQMIALSTGCVMTSRSPVAFPQLSHRCPAGQFDVSCASSGMAPPHGGSSQSAHTLRERQNILNIGVIGNTKLVSFDDRRVGCG